MHVVKTTWRGAGAPSDVQDEADKLLSEYLTSEEGPFHEDYAPGAWGGYDGPFVIGVEVTRMRED